MSNSFSERVTVGLLRSVLTRRSSPAICLVIALLAAGIALGYLAGGAHQVPPHWFYLPILFAGVRFGLRGSLLTALAATLLAGPLLPGHVATAHPQEVSDWAARGVFFVVVGAALPVMLRLGTEQLSRELASEQLEAEVLRGLDRGEFVLHYQPIVDLTDGRVLGAEALLRWEHPERGMLGPAEFIGDVERLGEFTTWVLHEATATAALWRRAFGRGDLFVSVNVSAQNLAQPDFVAQVRTALRSSGLEPENLYVAVTESAMISEVDHVSARLQVLRSTGVKVAIDDFGTGHATLAYLRELPADAIKIDRSFVASMGDGQRGGAIVASVLEMAERLGVGCVAEGVETEDQRAGLLRGGCRRAQGYLFSRPVPGPEFQQLLLQDSPATS